MRAAEGCDGYTTEEEREMKLLDILLNFLFGAVVAVGFFSLVVAGGIIGGYILSRLL